jgi:hypothetical protein
MVFVTSVLLMSLSGQAAQDPLSRFLPSDVTTRKGTIISGHLLVGRADGWPGAPDFFCRESTSNATRESHPLADGTPKCYAKGMVLGDIGDAPDLVLRRAGPDNAHYNDAPSPVAPDTTLGGLYWQAWGSRCEPGQYGFWSGCGGNGRTAEIYSRTAGEQTGTSRAGSLHLATTPLGNNGNPVDRMVISHDGRITLNTAVGMRDVEVGEPDSCGTGYRCLRVAN